MKTKMLEVLKKIDLSGLDYDDLMDTRDADKEFESEWLESYERIKGRHELKPMKGEIDLLREWAFKYIFAQTENHDLAASVSDDLGLILSTAILGSDEEWVHGLWWEYKSGRIPTGGITRRPGAIKDSI